MIRDLGSWVGAFFCAEEKSPIFCCISSYLRGFKEISGTIPLDVETGLLQTYLEVGSVVADMIVLTENFLSLIGLGDRKILKGLINSDWYNENCPSIVFQYSG